MVSKNYRMWYVLHFVVDFMLASSVQINAIDL